MLRLGIARLGWLPTTLLGYVAAGFVSFGVVSPPEHCPEVTVDDLRNGASSAVQWLVGNQRADGSYLYDYRREGDVVVDGYNPVRHSGVVMSLYMAASYGVGGSFPSAERGLEWSLARLTMHDGWAAAGGAVDQPSVGATALLVAALAERRDQTGETRYDDVMGQLSRFLIGQVDGVGAVSASFDVSTWSPVANDHSVYFTGETYWALLAMQRLFPDGPWTATAARVGDYIAGPRDEAEDMRHTRDQWAAYGLSDVAALAADGGGPGLTSDQIDYVRHQAGITAATVRWLSQEAGPWGTAVRGVTRVRGGGYGTIGEGLTRLWRVARDEPALADIREPIGQRALCLAALTLSHQTAAAGASDPEPGRVSGAWFRDGETRMDDQQHALSALLQSIDILRAEPVGGSTGGDGNRPSTVLWLVVLVVALNPARTARLLGAHRAGGGGQRRIVAAGTVAAVVLILAALAAGRILDVLDVSKPAFRVSAGALGVLAGVLAVARRRRPVEPASAEAEGWSPAAIVARLAAAIAPAPAIALTISAAADRGVLLVVVSTAIAAAASAAAMAVRGRAVATIFLDLVERAGAAVLVVVAVLVIVAGVLSV